MTSVLILLSGFDEGTYYVEDDGIPGNGIAQLRGPSGDPILFNIPTEFLTITASPGRNVVFNLTEWSSLADITVGSLTDSTQNPDSIAVMSINGADAVTLAATGGITEVGSDAGADIRAASVVFSAGTGIGAAGNAIETQTSLLEAETDTGGINLSNFGTVEIGGISADVDGLEVVTSGNINFSTIGAILLRDDTGTDSVRGGTSGNVTLIASGIDSDIIADVDNDAIAAPGGNIVLQAGRDVGFGVFGTNFDNDVRARGSVTINAGRDFLIDGFADLASDDFGGDTGGNVVITTGRNIHVRSVAGADGSILASGNASADVILTTGPYGAVLVDPASIGSSHPITSSSGNVTVNTDRILINSASGIAAVNGQVTLRTATDGREIFLGSAGDAALALELSDAELDRIFTSNLIIGSSSSGDITVLSAISSAVPNVTLRTGEDLRIGAAFSGTTALTLNAGNSLYHTAGTISTGTLTALVDTSGDDGGIGGLGQLFSVGATTTSLAGAGDNDTLRGSEGIDQAVHGNGGNDTITSSGEGHYFGDAGNDRMFAGLSSGLVPEVLDGGSGIDTLDTSSFGGSYVINLATGVTNFAFESFLNFENVITGNGADDITGSSADNVINGGAGADTMRGGLGDDDFIVDDAGDVAIEAANSGNDRVLSSVSYSLAGQHIERLRLTGFGNIDGTGNSLANTIAGNDGNNVLDGAGGADTMAGGLGNDDYIVNNVGDVAVEAANSGNDRVLTSVSYSLAGQHIERLRLTGTGDIDGTGNSLVNTIAGNDGDNVIDGGAGADTMSGGLGDDDYIVDNVGDVASEVANSGNDRVLTSVSYSLAGQHIERLRLTGTDNINATGNSLDNGIAGNTGNNIIAGGTGTDRMSGLAGNDTFVFNSAAETGVGATRDVIQDFEAVGDNDTIDLSGFAGTLIFSTASTLSGALNEVIARQVGDDVLIQINTVAGGGAEAEILLENTLVAQVTASDFDLV